LNKTEKLLKQDGMSFLSIPGFIRSMLMPFMLNTIKRTGIIGAHSFKKEMLK